MPSPCASSIACPPVLHEERAHPTIDSAEVALGEWTARTGRVATILQGVRKDESKVIDLVSHSTITHLSKVAEELGGTLP
jgi:hypothetical protein